MNKFMQYLATMGCLVLISTGSGCQSATDTDDKDHGHGHSHEHSDSPKSLPAAIAELEEMWGQIRTAMDEDDPESAHDPLHHIGPLLQAMPDLAADTDLPESEWQEVKEHADQLFKAFGDIDAAFHKTDGDKQEAYDSAKSAIDEGIHALEAKLPSLGVSPIEPNNKHDHHHDEEHTDHDKEHSDHE